MWIHVCDHFPLKHAGLWFGLTGGSELPLWKVLPAWRAGLRADEERKVGLPAGKLWGEDGEEEWGDPGAVHPRPGTASWCLSCLSLLAGSLGGRYSAVSARARSY